MSRRETNVPNGVNTSTKEYKLPSGGRVHIILWNAMQNKGTIARKDIPGTTFTAKHIAHAELFGLIKRTSKRPLTYKITPLGIAAFRKLTEALPKTLPDDELVRLKHNGRTKKRFREWQQIIKRLQVKSSKETKVQEALGTVKEITPTETLQVNYKFVKVGVNITEQLYKYHRERIW